MRKEIELLIQKYARYRDNVQWHIDTNQSKSHELDKSQKLIQVYDYLISDLKAIITKKP